MSDTEFVPSTPKPEQITLWASAARTVIAGLSGAGVSLGAIAGLTDSQISGLVAAIMVILSVVLWIATGAWSLWQKYGAEKKLNQAAVASASKRTPVEPSTTPPPP